MRLSSVVILVGEASHRREWFLWRKILVSLRRGERLCLAEYRTYQLTAEWSGSGLLGMGYLLERSWSGFVGIGL